MSTFSRCIKRHYSCRWRLCYACAIALLLMHTLRVNISIALVCMVKTPNRTTEELNITLNNQRCSGLNDPSPNQNYEGEFEWSDTLQSNMLAAFFYGYISTNILAGVMADKYGGKRVLGVSFLSASILTILHPRLSRISGYFTLVLRILTGAVLGSTFPGIQSLFGRWIPPEQISLFIGIILAFQILGSILGFSISGYLCVYGFDNGWGSIFYVFGGLSLVFSCVWFYVVYDNPDVHPTISEEERTYLKIAVKSENSVKNVPWKQMFTSQALWGLTFGLFAYGWTDLSFQTLLPLYMKEVLNVEITSNGLMSSAPSIGQIFALPLWGKLADVLCSKKYLSTRSVRVLFHTVSMLGSAGLLIAIGFLRCDQTFLISLLLFLSGTILSFSSGSVFVNHNDIAPSYAGIVFGIANFFATTSGSISSLTAKALTPNGTQEEWRIVFILCASVCVCGAILFATMASGDIQKWARSNCSSVSVHIKNTNSEKRV